MKKALRFLAVAVLLLASTPVWAYDFSAVAPSGQTLYYNIDDSNVTVTYPGSSSSSRWSGYTKPTGNLTIPSSVTNGGTTYSVISIESYTFSGCGGLTSVTIPNSVTSISNSTFLNCSGLTTVTIPESVTSIGNHAFSGCTGLTTITIPESVTSIGSNAFKLVNNIVYYGTATGSPWSAKNVNGFEDDGFIYSDNTKTTVTGYVGLDSVITIPNSATTIGDNAFHSIIRLTSVTIGNSVISIGNNAFQNCIGLTSVTIPNSVTSIDFYAFNYCIGLTSVVFNATNCTFMGSSSFCVFNGCTNLASLTIGENVTNIPDFAFLGCSGLTSVTFGNAVTSIGQEAFSDCRSLHSVTIPESVTSIGTGAFSGCNSLTSVTIPEFVTSIGTGAFSGCSGLISVTIPNSVISIGNYTFRDCTSLTSVTIPNSIISIGNDAFRDCTSLTSVTIGNFVTSIGGYAFSGCSGLTSVTIPDSVTSIGNYAFWDCCGLDTVFMKPTTPPSLGSDVFSDNASGRVFILFGCTYNDYYNASSWIPYRSALREPIIDIDINVVTNDVQYGNAFVIQHDNHSVRCDSTAVIQATANDGYHFDHWSNGNTDNPDTLYLNGDTTVTAFFVPNQYVLTANINEPSLGTITVPEGSLFNYNDTLEIFVTPNEHHHVYRWDGDGIIATSALKDTVWVHIIDNTSITAYIAIDTHSVSVTTSDIARGIVESTGTEFVYGTPCTATATAYTGYTFAGWSNGITANPYTFAVLSDVELTAIFVEEGEEPHTVTVESADPTMGSATVNGTPSATVLDGDEATLVATANEGYHFVQWNDSNTDNPRTITVTADVTYTAYFASNTEGVEEAGDATYRIDARDGRVILSGAEGCTFGLYSVDGRTLYRGEATEPMVVEVPQSGVYILRIGDRSVRKVVVVR